MRILLVDDDSSVLQSLVAILKTIPGHDLRLAANAQKAHEQAAALGGLDLLITDIVMEPTDGFTLRAELQALYPQMDVIFISGYDLSDYGEQIAGAHVLAKPVDAGVLRGLITGSVKEMISSVTGATPVAVPGAPQAVAAQPRAVAQPQAAPVARPVSSPPQPAAVRTAVPVAVPMAVPHANAVPRLAQPVAQPQSGVRASAPADPLIGVQVGDYRVQQLLSKGEWGNVYRAIQLSVNRPVDLNVLDPLRAQDENQRSLFLADARAKAAVQHPFIVSVFEADDRNGLAFYTNEHLEGSTLAQLNGRGQPLDEKAALHVMKVCAEGLNYLWTHNLAHVLLDGTSVRIGKDNIARLSNLASSTPDPLVSPQAEIQTVGAIVRQLVPAQAQTPGLRALFARMSGGGNAITAWPVVLQAVKALEPKVIPVEAAKIKAADAAAMKAVEAARIAQKRSIAMNIATLIALVVIVGFVIFKYLISNKRDLREQVQIPAGEYLLGEVGAGRKASLGAYEIDRYEVTIGDYAEFIDFCEKNPDQEHKFDHKNARRHISHITDEVKKLIGNAKVRDKTVFKQEADPSRGLVDDPGVAVDLNCPMVGITWWDAYAYANYRGRELPTDEEWEAAARGKKGYKYPWGDELKLKYFNSNEGYKSMAPGGTKTDDGYNYWSPVDTFTDDESPLKVRGMAGNVSEWIYRVDGKTEIPEVRGGSFATPPVTMFESVKTLGADDCWFIFPATMKPKGNVLARPGETERFYAGDAITANVRALYIGFRTVKRK